MRESYLLSASTFLLLLSVSPGLHSLIILPNKTLPASAEVSEKLRLVQHLPILLALVFQDLCDTLGTRPHEVRLLRKALHFPFLVAQSVLAGFPLPSHGRRTGGNYLLDRII